ncbi:hypothetical protein BVC80_1835g573 [Macleaya cordata]|uniref:Interactor of constitutive active ROPs n=1 Tax=Macleaya cordata TaxID=56857 RepID=A0A200R645_MACCD|nr:hypothetical protein BVC80_1835g573 [Macleaya cordata]
MQTPKARTGSSEVPQRTSPVTPRTARQLKVTGSESDSASSHPAIRTPKDRSPKVIERRSPRSPVTELQKKRPSKLSELESQLAQLQEDLKAAKDQLGSSESCKNRAEQEAEEAKKQLIALNAKLEESQRQLLELSSSEEARLHELQKSSQEHDQSLQTELEAVQKQHSEDSAALASALDEIERLKIQLEVAAESQTTQTKHAETTYAEIQSLKSDLAETLVLVENLNTQLRDCKESEAQAQALVNETLMQFQTVKETAETLRSEGLKTMDAYNSLSSELEKSKMLVSSLEELVSRLQLDLVKASRNHSGDNERTREIGEDGHIGEPEKLKMELDAMKLEVEQLGRVLEETEIKYKEEQLQFTVQIQDAYELVDRIKSDASLREAELVAELEKSRAHIDELKATLMDKETELQSISEENEGLSMKIVKNQSSEIQSELEMEFKKSKEDFTDLKACLMDKETELQSILEENEVLKSEVKKKEMEKGKVNDEAIADAEVARAAEQEALKKLGYAKQEADESSRRAARVAEQLDAAQASNSELEAELRRLKVQSDQWRKAAEAAAAVISTANNGRFMERSGSMDSNYHPVTGKLSSPYSDMDDDSPKKKNSNMLKKIGVLWKKGQK